MPKVSVILPVYNSRVDHLKEAIKSILNQTHTDLELIIIDNGCPPPVRKTIDDIALFDVRVLRLHTGKPNLVEALNTGVAFAHGKYIARMDGDDISRPDRLRRQIEFMEARPDVDVCASDSAIINEDGVFMHNYVSSCYNEDFLDKMLSANIITHGSVMGRAVVFKDNVYSANPDHLHIEDYELWLRLIIKRKLKFYILPDVLFERRFTRFNISSTCGDIQEKNVKLLLEHYTKTAKNMDTIKELLTHESSFVVDFDAIYGVDGSKGGISKHHPTYQYFIEKKIGVPKKETSLFKFLSGLLERGYAPAKIYNIKSEQDIYARLAYLETLKDELEEKGFQEVPVPTFIIDNLGRLRPLDGQNRLAIWHFLGHDKVKVKVVARHKDWLDFKERLFSMYATPKLLYSTIDHPDFRDWKVLNDGTRYDAALFEIVMHTFKDARHLKPEEPGNFHYRASSSVLMLPNKMFETLSVLDIGSHLGFHCFRLAKIGFRCTGVEANKFYYDCANYLGNSQSSFVTFVNKPAQEFVKTETGNYDVCLLLNVIHHINMGGEGSVESVLSWVGKHCSLFITEFGEGKIKDTKEEFIDFVGKVTGLKYKNSLGKEPSLGRELLSFCKE